MIHPTAIIDSGAQLGADCEVGPYCVIGAHVILGARCRLISHVVIDGHTTIGNDNQFYPFCSVGLKTQDLKWKGGTMYTRIGDRNTIRECVTIHSATSDGEATIIGSDNNILAGSHIGHNVVMRDHVIVSMAALAGHVLVEDYAVVGGLSAVHQFCRVGTMGMIGGCSKVTQDVPPYMIVDGNPAETRMINKVGLERNGVSETSQAALRSAHRIFFRDGLTIPNALAKIEAEVPDCAEVRHLLQFLRTSERGITK